MELDRLDERILAELDNDARQSNSQIAKKLRVNKNVVNYRIKNLERSGIIKGYYTVIDNYRLGYSSYRVYLKLQYASPATEKEIMEYLVSLPQTWWVGYSRGITDICALFGVKTQKEFVDVWTALNSRFREYIGQYTVVIYHGLEHYRLPFTKRYLKENARMEAVGVGETIRIDETDRRLLSLMAAKGRISLLEVAAQLKLTPAAIQYRIKQLVRKRIILGFRAIVDTAKLGYTLYKMDFNLRDTAAYPKMQKFAQTHPDIFYLDKTAGYADIEIEAYTKTPQRFYEVMDEIRSKFAADIRNVDFFTFSEITKISYMPRI